MQGALAALVATLLVAALGVAAEEHVDVVVAVDAEGRLVGSVAETTPFRVPPSRIAALDGYAGTSVGFRSLDPKDATSERRPPDPGAHLAFELIYADRGVAVLEEEVGVPMRRGDLFKIGPAPFDRHPTWILDADLQRPSKVTIRLVDRARIHTPGRVMSLTFAPDPANEAWLCGARCEGQKAYDAPGRCAVCGAPLSLATTARFSAVVTPDRPLRPDVPVRLAIALRDPSGAPLTVDDGMLDVYVVSADLSTLAYGRPVRNPDGTFHLPATFPESGLYTLFFEFALARVGVQRATADIVVGGPLRDRVALEPDGAAAKTIEGYTVTLTTAGPLVPLREIPCTFSVKRDGAPVRDLAPVRGALGQLVVVGENRSFFLHRPARAGAPGSGPDVTFQCVFPAPGLYRAWAQMKHGDTVLTVPFTLAAERADAFRPRRRTSEKGEEGIEDTAEDEGEAEGEE